MALNNQHDRVLPSSTSPRQRMLPGKLEEAAYRAYHYRLLDNLMLTTVVDEDGWLLTEHLVAISSLTERIVESVTGDVLRSLGVFAESDTMTINVACFVSDLRDEMAHATQALYVRSHLVPDAEVSPVQ